MRSLTVVFALIVVSVGTAPALAQESPSRSVTLGLGVARNLQDYPDLPKLGPYAELGFHSPLYVAREAGLTLIASLYIGGWTDGVSSPSHCKDCITYSRSSGIMGFKVGAKFDQMPIPLSLWIGGSEHITRFEYVGGAGVSGNIGKDHWRTYAAVASGITLDVRVRQAIGIVLNVGWHVPVPHSENTPTPVRFSGSVGVSYSL